MKQAFTRLVAVISLLAGGEAMASDFFQWQSNSLTYLYGQNFEVDPDTQQTITFEHADSWKYGDNFLFVDTIFFNGKNDPATGSHTLYGEFSPRLSFTKISGHDFSIGPIKDVLLAGTYEFGEGDNESFLIGPGFDLTVPGFDYVQLNFYKRHSRGPRAGDNIWQITPAWSYTFPVGRSDIVVDGFIDWVIQSDKNSRGEYHRNIHVNPQIKYDMGKALNMTAQHLYVGFEYDYWKNKYGIKNTSDFDTNQNTASLLVKVFW